MKAIGIDFGTTNSTISFIKETRGVQLLEGFEPYNGRSEYMPSVVAYKEHDDILVGFRAAEELTSGNFELYENFKLHLAKNSIPNRTKKATQVMSDYIQGILNLYKQRQGIKEFDGVVMTIPYAWLYKEENHSILERIEKEIKKASESTVHLTCEPEAAAAYFCYEYEHNREINPKGQEYKGHIFVIDYGGGTLDVTLCKARGNQIIEIVDGYGTGEFGKSSGYAGVAFDEAVVLGLMTRYDFQSIQQGGIEFIKLRKEFENKKITNNEIITEAMKRYFNTDKKINRHLFSLGKDDKGKEVQIFCKDLDEAFIKTCSDELMKALATVKEKAGDICNDRENFRIQLVGGFSNFVSVEIAVREAFGIGAKDADTRLDAIPYPPTDRALAISKGAALIANGWGVVDTCRHSYGYVSYVRGASDEWVEKHIKVIEKGTSLSDVKEPKFADEWVRIKGSYGNVRVYGDSGKSNNEGLLCVILDESTGQLFPNLDGRAKLFQIGFSVNRYQVPSIHTRDSNGAEIMTSMRKLKDSLEAMEK